MGDMAVADHREVPAMGRGPVPVAVDMEALAVTAPERCNDGMCRRLGEYSGYTWFSPA